MDGKPKILIVDDEAEVGEILGVLLEDHFDCAVFTDAVQALEAMRRSSFPLVITDLEMPELNGLRFIELARTLNQEMTILISTGHDADHPRVRQALEAGANDILSKPFMKPEDLIRFLQTRMR